MLTETAKLYNIRLLFIVARELGFEPLGEDCGNADALCDFILSGMEVFYTSVKS